MCVAYPAPLSLSEISLAPSGSELLHTPAWVPPMWTGNRPDKKDRRVGEQ